MSVDEGGQTSEALDPFHAMLGRALIDEAYRAKLLDPDTRLEAVMEIGVAKPTETQMRALQNAITALQTVAGSFGEGVGAA